MADLNRVHIRLKFARSGLRDQPLNSFNKLFAVTRWAKSKFLISTTALQSFTSVSPLYPFDLMSEIVEKHLSTVLRIFSVVKE